MTAGARVALCCLVSVDIISVSVCVTSVSVCHVLFTLRALMLSLGGIGTLVRIKRKMVTVTVGFNCHCDTPGRSVSEGLSRSGWPVGVPVRDCLS